MVSLNVLLLGMLRVFLAFPMVCGYVVLLFCLLFVNCELFVVYFYFISV